MTTATAILNISNGMYGTTDTSKVFTKVRFKNSIIQMVPITYTIRSATTDEMISLAMTGRGLIFIIKIVGIVITTKPITYPNVGPIPLLNPAYIGRSIPKPRYAPVIIKESIMLSVTKQIKITIKNCKETLIFSPKGMASIPNTHKIASNTASLQIRLVVIFILVIKY